MSISRLHLFAAVLAVLAAILPAVHSTATFAATRAAGLAGVQASSAHTRSAGAKAVSTRISGRTSAATTQGIATTTSSGCPGSTTACQQAVLTLLNSARKQYAATYGRTISPLTLSQTQSQGTSTCAGSLGHSVAMAKSGSIWHTNPSYPAASFPRDLCVSFTTAGENVGEASYGNELTDLQQIQAMMLSETHTPSFCATAVNHACNIVNAGFHTVGIGIVHANNVTWLTEDFTN